MKRQHSLDHDGLDGILRSSHKPQFKKSYFRLFWLVPILIIIASAVFWLPKIQQTYPLKSSTKNGNQPHSSNGITIAKNESSKSSISTQSEQTRISSKSGNVFLPSRSSLAESALPGIVASNQSPVTLENQSPPFHESAEAKTASSEKPPVIKPVPAANPQEEQDKSYNPLIIDIIKVKFAFASSELKLTKTEKTDLTSLVERCNNQIEITGYTCNLGLPDQNQKLGLARAHALKRLLIRNGVSAERIITASKGMKNPVASNETPYGRALNRRAELTCKGKQ